MDGEATVKRVFRESGRLRSSPPMQMSPIYVSEDVGECEIMGGSSVSTDGCTRRTDAARRSGMRCGDFRPFVSDVFRPEEGTSLSLWWLKVHQLSRGLGQRVDA